MPTPGPSQPTSPNLPNLAFLAGGGEMGSRMRAMDWTRTPLGPPDAWPQSLRSTVSMLLPSKAQIALFWGPEFVVLYNDAYRPVFGGKHPSALGQPGSVAWSEIWDRQLQPLLAGVVATGEAFWAKDLLFHLERYGFIEETYFDVSYDPVRVESGEVGGVFCIVTETTERVVGARRMALLKDLAARNAAARTARDACRLTIDTLGASHDDITFALACLDDEVVATTPHAQTRLAGAPAELVQHLPVASTIAGARAARLVVGLNPRRPFDEAYRGFLGLVADQFGTTLANAYAYEEERKRAESLAEIDRAKTAFFSNVSHEFRTPLTLMLGPVENLLGEVDGPLTGTQRQDIEILRRNAGRLMKLVNALLEFSRFEAGRAQATYVPTDVSALTRDLAGAFRSAIEHAGIRFDVACDEVPEQVFLDRDMWEKIVLNLLSNALKFTMAGSIGVSLRAGTGAFELRVTDTGTGIPEPELPRVFERFHRVEGARGRTHEGTGIGLALTTEFVRLHGGTVTAESRLGEGSTFTVHMPTGSAHLPQDRVQRTAPSTSPSQATALFVDEAARWLPEDAGSPEGGPEGPPDTDRGASVERILVVDDNADMREHLRKQLRDWTVTTATDGRAALEMARTDAPSLIVTDVMMPGLDGFAFLRELRADPRTSAIPVLMLSARAGEEARVSGLDAGADDYVVKPFSARELTARVRSLLSLTRARREAELQKQHLRALFMQAPTPIVILRGPDHVVEFANPMTCTLWGRTEAEVVGRPLLQALPDLRSQPFKGLLDDVYRTGIPYVGKEIPARLDRRGDGRVESVYFNFVYAPLHGVDGAIEGVLIVAFDVSDEVTARNEMDQLRTAAEAASRTKDQFMAMLGHELRNPLAPILTALQLMALRGDNTSIKERTVIDRQVRHLVRLVDDLLDVSRIARGKIELRQQPIDVADIVAAAIEATSPVLEERQHLLEVDVPHGLLVRGDMMRLTQVLVNVISNAAKYTEPRGRVHVSARLENGADGTAHGPFIEIRVKDSGIGISPDMLPRVFEMFAQERQSSDRSNGGLGLGLTIVKSLVELHGGTVQVFSAGAGLGSEFVLRLPAAVAASDAQRGTAANADAAAVPPRQCRRILVVDDNVDAARMMAAALEVAGHEAHIAFDGPSALDAAAAAPPDAALLDLGLPLMDGYELAQQLVAANPGRRPILIAVTGYGQVSDRERTAAAGFDAHVVKPVDIAHLIELVDGLCATVRGGDPPRPA